ncbi:hypothetical protein JCM13304A_18590 [Desulfothermus okinawensis JCM 13304]
MAKKNIQIVSVLLIGIVAGFLGGYLFKQSSKLKEVNRVAITSQNSSSNTKQGNSVEEKGKIFKKDLLAEITKKSGEISSNKEEEATKKVEPQGGTSLKRWINKYVITPYFIEDLVEFILNVYEPPLSKDNPSSEPKLNISLKSLNARYGLELIGFKVEASSLEKARKKILQNIMDPDLLKAQYEHFIDEFIGELMESAQETTKVFVKNGKPIERELNKEEIKALLLLLSQYVEDLSKVLTSISADRNLFLKLDKYLKEEVMSMHYNYQLNQIINNYNLERQKLTQEKSDMRREEILEGLKKKREEALKNYEISIKRREQLRSEIISSIEKKNPNLRFSSSEILYICEWVHRRIKEGQSLEKIKQIGIILDLASEKMRQKASTLL